MISDLKIRVIITATAQKIGIGDGVKTEFQLVKTCTSGNTTVTREIKKQVIGTVKLYRTVNLCTSLDYSVDYTTGIVSFNKAPAADVVIIADFEFDALVRFDIDEP